MPRLPNNIELKSKKIYDIFNPNHFIENNERNTSSNYTLWDEADVYLIEWPGSKRISSVHVEVFIHSYQIYN